MDMGEKIYTLRKEMGLTLEQLGDRVGVGKSTVRKWENGMIANMKRNKIIAVAKALNTTPAYLMGWEDSPTPEQTPVPNPDQLSNDEKTLVTNYRILDSTDRMKAQGYIEGLALDEKYQKKEREGTA